MKIAFPIGFAVWVLFTFSGCADMINSLREESAAIDREHDSDRDLEDVAEYKPRAKLRDEGNPPEGLGRGGRRLASFSSDNEGGGSFESPRSGSPPPSYRRVTRHDFVDNEANENSLWDPQGQNNFLFSHNRNRDLGDLVTADVEKELKRDIQYQLWMTLPPEQRRPKRTPASAKGEGAKPADVATADKTGEEKNKDAAEEAAKTNMASGGKDDDTVRMEIAENMGNGLVRVVGQKRVIYRGVARVVEVVALVNSKDLDDNNRVKSSAFIDTKTQVIQ